MRVRVRKLFNILSAGVGAGAGRFETFGAGADSASVPALRGMEVPLRFLKK